MLNLRHASVRTVVQYPESVCHLSTQAQLLARAQLHWAHERAQHEANGLAYVPAATCELS